MKHVAFAVVVFTASLASGQQQKPLPVFPPRYTFTFQATGMSVSSVRDSFGGIGGGFTYGVKPWLGIDAAVIHFPEHGLSRDAGHTQVLGGVMLRGAGFLAGDGDVLPIFIKVRAGTMHMGGQYAALNHGSANYPAFDVGAGLEWWTRKGIYWRAEVGNTLIYFNKPFLRAGEITSRRPGLTSNLQVTFGIGYAF